MFILHLLLSLHYQCHPSNILSFSPLTTRISSSISFSALSFASFSMLSSFINPSSSSSLFTSPLGGSISSLPALTTFVFFCKIFLLFTTKNQSCSFCIHLSCLCTSEKEMSLGSFLTAWGASLVGYGNSGGKVLWQCKNSVT
ncbi:hypothetical protein BDE02_01G217000 [Populus trichocarpa]|nr:hypothetical protein BDE02_01G217000 [Populus trichocarpa]